MGEGEEPIKRDSDGNSYIELGLNTTVTPTFSDIQNGLKKLAQQGASIRDPRVIELQKTRREILDDPLSAQILRSIKKTVGEIHSEYPVADAKERLLSLDISEFEKTSIVGLSDAERRKYSGLVEEYYEVAKLTMDAAFARAIHGRVDPQIESQIMIRGWGNPIEHVERQSEKLNTFDQVNHYLAVLATSSSAEEPDTKQKIDLLKIQRRKLYNRAKQRNYFPENLEERLIEVVREVPRGEWTEAYNKVMSYASALEGHTNNLASRDPKLNGIVLAALTAEAQKIRLTEAQVKGNTAEEERIRKEISYSTFLELGNFNVANFIGIAVEEETPRVEPHVNSNQVEPPFPGERRKRNAAIQADNQGSTRNPIERLYVRTSSEILENMRECVYSTPTDRNNFLAFLEGSEGERKKWQALFAVSNIAAAKYAAGDVDSVYKIQVEGREVNPIIEFTSEHLKTILEMPGAIEAMAIYTKILREDPNLNDYFRNRLGMQNSTPTLAKVGDITDPRHFDEIRDNVRKYIKQRFNLADQDVLMAEVGAWSLVYSANEPEYWDSYWHRGTLRRTENDAAPAFQRGLVRSILHPDENLVQLASLAKPVGWGLLGPYAKNYVRGKMHILSPYLELFADIRNLFRGNNVTDEDKRRALEEMNALPENLAGSAFDFTSLVFNDRVVNENGQLVPRTETIGNYLMTKAESLLPVSSERPPESTRTDDIAFRRMPTYILADYHDDNFAPASKLIKLVSTPQFGVIGDGKELQTKLNESGLLLTLRKLVILDNDGNRRLLTKREFRFIAAGIAGIDPKSTSPKPSAMGMGNWDTAIRQYMRSEEVSAYIQ